MKRMRLFGLVCFALLAALFTGCGPGIQPAPPPLPTKDPASRAPASSILSEIILPAVIPADTDAVVSVGYYIGETRQDGSHRLMCSFPDQDGGPNVEKWQAEGKDRVEVHSFVIRVNEPGNYAVNCQIDSESYKSVNLQVIRDPKNVEAEVREVTAGPSGDSGVNFYVLVSYVYGGPAAGELICSYPDEDGSTTQQTFPFTRPEPVEEYAGQPGQLQFDITVKKPGQYSVTCYAPPGNKYKGADFTVAVNGQAEVRSVAVAPADVLGQKFHVTVTSSYGADSSTEVLCTCPDENGAAKQQRISFVRPDPVKKYIGSTRQDAFDLTVKKAGTYQVSCRVDPGGAEQGAQFTVKEPSALAIQAVVLETGQTAGNTLVFTDQVKLRYDPKEKTLTGTLAGQTSSETTDDCKDSDGNITHNAYATTYNYLAEVNSPLTPGQEVKIPVDLAANVHIVVTHDSHVCEPVSGDMNLKWTGTLTILLAEDGSYTLSTSWADTMGATWAGSATGKAEPAAGD